MTHPRHHRELILYATPSGPLAEDLGRYFAAATRLGPTQAQTYPPHISLTGFFHREPDRADEVGDEVCELLAELGPVPPTAVTIDEVSCDDEWVGLTVTSPWLLDLTNEFIGRHHVGPYDDALRPKHWLHLSLAYGLDHGLGQRIDRYATLADELVDPTAEADWDVSLWERRAEPGGHRWYQRSHSLAHRDL